MMAAPASEAPEPEPTVPVRILAPSGEVALEDSLPAKWSVATLLQSLQGETPTGRLSLLRGTELLERRARLGELDLTEEESLYLVKRATGKYTAVTSGDDHDVLAKCLLIGAAGAGKSSLLRAIGREDFVESYRATIGVEFSTRRWQAEEGLTLKLQIWDTAGLERFRAVVSMYYRGAPGFLAVFSLNSRESLEELRRVLRETQEQYPESCRCICIVGTHADVPEPEVTQEEALQLADELGWPFFAVSCKTGEGVDDPFFAWLDMYIDRVMVHRVADQLMPFMSVPAIDHPQHACAAAPLPEAEDLRD